MGKIKVLRESDLRGIGDSQSKVKVYPVTSADAVYFTTVTGNDTGKLSAHVRPRKVLSESQFDNLSSLNPNYDYYIYEDE